ncbi:MAG: 50S ribosomal protein L9 [Geminicoccaceae bacterium]|nr:50S ribosomal protein L9 [Geminicoccaceae bacterium]
MQVILLERVSKLGQMGEIVNVRPGYARNFLIPKGKALRATDEALQRFEGRRAELEANNQQLREEAEGRRGSVDGKSIIVLRQASESKQLYGSVSQRDIVEALAADGIELSRAQIRLEQPIKTTGIHDVTVELHPEVEVHVQVNVARSREEADIQAGLAPDVEPEREEEVKDDDAPDPRLANFDLLDDD